MLGALAFLPGWDAKSSPSSPSIAKGDLKYLDDKALRFTYMFR